MRPEKEMATAIHPTKQFKSPIAPLPNIGKKKKIRKESISELLSFDAFT